MVVISNFLRTLLDNFNYYYHNMTDTHRFIFYVLLALLFIIILFVIVTTEGKGSKKVKDNKTIEPTMPSKDETGDISFNEENEKTRNLMEISQKIQEVIDNRNIDLTQFEREQEETSIISYEELLKAAGQPKPEYTEDHFKLPDLVKKIEVNEIIEKEPIVNEAREERFKKSDFISPIFGIQNLDKPITFQDKDDKKGEEIRVQPIVEEIVVDDCEILDIEEHQFLKELKTLRNNLS
jgi:hypothetical protein